MVAFDTLKFAQTLREKGKFTAEQAEGLAEAFSQASADQLATKSDIGDVRSDLRSTEASLRADLRQTELRLEAAIKVAVADSKSEILKWTIGTIGFQTVVILGAVLALSRFGH